jgi:hypothetical protein
VESGVGGGGDDCVGVEAALPNLFFKDGENFITTHCSRFRHAATGDFFSIPAFR